ncbi:MAG TPA: BON domain-containing protein [Verrucomicrobiae bacterium]|jgi:osmotically-inducible protein OsmY|nr:BON domain-containing protein [Verrucomicrobiae bacterium]
MKTDKKLKDALVAQLNFWLGRSAERIEVTVKDGTVTLRGSVPYYEEKINGEEMVRRTGGVKAVLNDLVVELPETRKRTDAEITTSAANAIGWITTVPPNSIEIAARAGQLTLEGTVKNDSQKYAVEYAVRHLPGITGITNLITITPQTLHQDVKAAIDSSFDTAGIRMCRPKSKQRERCGKSIFHHGLK